MSIFNSKQLFSFVLISILLSIIYSNTLHSEWHLDDIQNIALNSRVQIINLSLESIKNSFFSDPNSPNRLYRPVACLTFAINALCDGDNVYYYHVVNTAMHVMTLLVLLILLKTIFQTPTLSKTDDDEKNFIVITAALLWAINPIQTQAVTYIVQRMTILSAFFSLTSMLLYLKARLISSNLRKKIALYFGCAITIILSVLSKENGAITPVLLGCMEIILFNKRGSDSPNKQKFYLWIFIISVSTIAACCYIFGYNPLSFFEYSGRTFSLKERILTQPRILLYYLSQILYPSPQRLSIEHDVTFSTDLFSPPQTILSIITIAILTLSPLFITRLNPLLRLSILFYFCGHVVESTIIPLEMMFEHRNYLPSALLFLPVGLLFFRLSKNRSLILSLLTTAILAFIIFQFSLWTYSRNYDWLTEKSLWEDAIKKAPNSARAKHGLGFYFDMNGELDKALMYYYDSLNGFVNDNKYSASTLGNIGSILSRKGEYDKAHHYLDKAIKINPDLQSAYLAKIECFIKEKKWSEAINLLSVVLEKSPDNYSANKFAAISHMHTANYKKALENLRICLKLKPDDIYTLLNIAEALSLSGFQDRSDFFYKLFLKKEPFIYLGMAKNNYMHGNTKLAYHNLTLYLRHIGIDNLQKNLENIRYQYELPMIHFEEMDGLIKTVFEEYKKELKFRN